MNDKQLRHQVVDELELKLGPDAANIGVAVKDGIVTLSGHVPDTVKELAAIRSVRHVEGVRAIAQEIEVRYPGSRQTADDEIAARALCALKWDPAVPYDDIQVTVEGGCVTLTGEVDAAEQINAAEKAVRWVIGVKQVASNIAVRPPSTAEVKSMVAVRSHLKAG